MKAKTKQPNNNDKMISMPVVNPHAAGIDIGSSSHLVYVSQDNVKEFGVFTSDLYNIVSHLQAHEIKTVSLESTGFYWQALFVILQDSGFEVYLVNARHLKNVKGHKTDVIDCRWLQLTHSIGLLSNSFQPDAFTHKLRCYVRHRKSIVEDASRFISKMDKLLVLMNIQLSNVLRDITCESGLKVIEAILRGEREPQKLEGLISQHCKSSRQDILKALTVDWRQEYLFELKNCYELYNFYWEKIRTLDNEIEILLKAHSVQSKQNQTKSTKNFKIFQKKQHQKNDPQFKVEQYAVQMTDGVDLLQIDGVGINTIMTIMTETGFDLTGKFPTAMHFASWLGFTPNRKISGGKKLSSRTRKKTNPLAKIIRDAANAAGNSQSRLGDFFERLAYRKGRMVAINATARKIAVVIYNMLANKQEFCSQFSAEERDRVKAHNIKNALKVLQSYNISKNEFDLQLT
jgi:transposase